MRIILLSILLTVCISLQAQNRYLVQFKDKAGTPYSLSNPSAYLSAKAIARRNAQGIAIDSTDLPILQRYIDSVRMAGNVTLLTRSKWLNQIAIQTNDAAALTKINAFPFVVSAAPIAFRQISIQPPFISNKFRQEAALPVSAAQPASTQRVQGDYYNYGNSYNQIHIHNGEMLHNYGFRGKNRTIAFLDAGYNSYLSNPLFDSVRLQNRIYGTWDFVANKASVNEEHYHGMACLSAVASNKPGYMVGTAPEAGFYLFRTEDVASEYPIEEQNWANAVEYADSIGADMISSSLGYYDFDDPQFTHVYADMNGTTTISARAASMAVRKGMIVTNSAGNNGGTPYTYIITPSDGIGVVAVGATDINGAIAGFSAWGPSYDGRVKPDIVSVGSGTYVSWIDGNVYPNAGTSFSNPNVNGLIACLWGAFPEMKAADVVDAVKRSADKFSNPDNRYGYGMPDFKKAFAILEQKTFSSDPASDGPCRPVLIWTAKDDSSMRYLVERKLPSESGFSTLATIKGATAAFNQNEYIYRDTLSLAADASVQYRVTLQLRTDTALTVFTKTVMYSPCPVLPDFVVGPNPFKDNITVSLNRVPAISKLSIRLINTAGQVLVRYEGSKPVGSYTQTINTGTLSAGLYILQVADNGKVLYSTKLICR